METPFSCAEGAKERISFIRPESLPGTEVMAAYHWTRRWNVFHERYVFCVCRKGAAGVRYRGVEDRICDRSVAIREPGETLCNTFVAKPAEFKILYVAPSLVEHVARDLGQTGKFHFAPHAITSDADLFDKLYRLCAAVENGHTALEQQALFAATMVALARHNESRTEPPILKNGKRAVDRAKAYLREHCSESVSLSELAALCRVSQFYLVHAFSQEAGVSPHAYQVRVRVERARHLLEKGVSAACAAASLGFSDQSHFTRHFKRVLQVTPSRYAAMRAYS